MEVAFNLGEGGWLLAVQSSEAREISRKTVSCEMLIGNTAKVRVLWRSSCSL